MYTAAFRDELLSDSDSKKINSKRRSKLRIETNQSKTTLFGFKQCCRLDISLFYENSCHPLFSINILRLWVITAPFNNARTLTFFTDVNHNYHDNQRTLKKRNKQIKMGRNSPNFGFLFAKMIDGSEKRILCSLLSISSKHKLKKPEMW